MPKNQSEIDARFAKVLQYKGIVGNDSRRQVMLKKSNEEKWKMILTHEKVMQEQENLFKIKETPECLIHMLKQTPSIENLKFLTKLLKEKDEEWAKSYLKLDGLETLFEVLVASTELQLNDKNSLQNQNENKEPEKKEIENKEPEKKEIQKKEPENKEPEKKETEKKSGKKDDDKDDDLAPEKSKGVQEIKENIHNTVQSEVIIAIRALMNKKSGMHAFITSEKSVEMMSRTMDTKNKKTLQQVFILLSTVCAYSESGFWLVLDTLNHFKNLKRESKRFETIVSLIKGNKCESSEDILLITTVMMLINSLINSIGDPKTKKVIKKEFKELSVLELVEPLKNKEEADDYLIAQIGAFEEEMDYGEELEEEEDKEVEVDNLENPMEILKLIRLQLSGTDGFNHFVNILQYFLIISGKSSQEEKVQNMSTLENIVKKAIALKEDGSIEEISVKELQLSDRIVSQQKKIQDYEESLAKLNEIINSGNINDSGLKTLLSSISGKKHKSIRFESKGVKFDLLDKSITSEVDKETEGILKSSNGNESDLVKNLSAEVKYLNYKLKKMEKKISEGGGSGGGGKGSGGSGSGSGSGSGGGSGSISKSESKSETKIETKKEEVKEEISSGPPPPPFDGDGPPPPPPLDGPPPPPFLDGPPPLPGMGPPPLPGMGPPPLPGGGPPGMGGGLPPLPKIKAQVPMKGLFWSKLQNKQLTGSIWIKNDLVKGLKDIKLNIDELQDEFSAKKKEEKEGDKKEEKTKVEKVVLVDPKKAQNASIILGSMRLSNEKIVEAILLLDDKVLKQEQIKALKDMAPSPDETTAIEEYKGDVNLLGPCEQYLLATAIFTRYEQRLNAWMFKNNFPAMIGSVQPDVDTVLLAIKQLKESKSFHKLLQIILAIGNFLNSKKGGIHGFQLSSLLKLKDLKSSSKMNLLGYIIKYVATNYPDVLKFKKELGEVEAATRVSLTGVKSEMVSMKKGIDEINNELEIAKPVSDKDKFRTKMIEFLDYASEEYEKLEEDFKKVEVEIEELRVLYGEDDKKFSFEEMLKTIQTFISQVEEVITEMKRKQEQEEKRLAKESKRNKKIDEKKKKRTDEEKTKKKPEKKSEGLVDDLEGDLLSGNAFKKKRKGKKKNNNIDINNLLQKMTEDSKKK